MPDSCPTRWAELSVPESAVHVDASADGDGDGTARHPFQRIERAIGAGARTVALEVGTYRENLTVERDVSIVGRCESGVVLDGSDGDADASTLTLEGSAVDLAHLTVTGGPNVGIRGDGASLSATDITVTGNTWHNINLAGTSTSILEDVEVSDGVPTDDGGGYGLIGIDGAVVSGTNVRVLRNSGLGVGSGYGATVELRGAEVAHTLENDAGEPGYGAAVYDSSVLSLLEGSLLDDNGSTAVTAFTSADGEPGPTLNLADVVITNVRTILVDMTPSSVGVSVGYGSHATITDTTIDGPLVGLLAHGAGTTAELGDVSVTTPGAGLGGITAMDGAGIELARVRVTGRYTASVAAEGRGTTIDAEDLVVADSVADQETVLIGVGVSDRARVSLTRGEVSGIEGSALYASDGAELVAQSVVVRDTLPTLVDVDGVEYEGGVAVLVVGADLTLSGCELTDNAGTAVLVADGAVATINAETSITRTVGSADVEVSGGEGVVVFSSAGTETSATLRNLSITGNDGPAVAVWGRGALADIGGSTITENRARAVDAYDVPAALFAYDGGRIEVDGSTIASHPGTAALAKDGGAELEITDSTISDIRGTTTDAGVGIAAVGDASVVVEDVDISVVEHAALYVEGLGTLACDDCTFANLGWAGGVCLGGTLDLEQPQMDADGAVVGVLAEGGTLEVSLGHLSGAVLAGAWVHGPGTYSMNGVRLDGSVGSDDGTSVLNGNGVVATGGVVAYDGTQGLRITDSTIEGNAGPGVLLVDAGAHLCGNEFTDNAVDVAQQACVSDLALETCDGEAISVDDCPEDEWPTEAPPTFTYIYASAQ